MKVSRERSASVPAVTLASTAASVRPRGLGALARWVARPLPRTWKERLRRGWQAARRWQMRRSARRLPRLLPPTQRHDLIVFPVIDWEFRFQRPQQLVSELARRGYRTFYLRTSLGGSSVSLARVAEKVATVELPGPPSFDLYRDSLTADLVADQLAGLAALRADFGLEEVVCCVQFPAWRPLVEAARQRWGWRVVYDCMDDHSAFASNGDLVAKDEHALVATSDLVVVSSRGLRDRLQSRAARLELIPNAADFASFNAPAPMPSDLAGLPRPIVGYYGAIAEWFDADMVATAARKRPDWQFVLIGSTVGADLAPLVDLPNIHLLGERPYATLPGYLHAFDVALIPFRRTPLTEVTNPVKIYEYLSAGKPVVAVDLPELDAFAGLVHTVRSPDELVGGIEAALQERSPKLVAARVAAARANTWQERTDRLEAAVRGLYPKVAIVIVAYADAGRLKMCLESIWEKTQHPNLTVVVVDNSGSGAMRELLTTMARREPRLRILLRDRNEGFPRANNLGIVAAGDCDYVVLLNDDTVVTRGWLRGLLRHLDKPGVELVGPVTNWAGNEARIEVDYETMAEMDVFAAAYARRHEGRASEIPMLAMFCVAMRRELLQRIGMLDERFGIGMFEDDDFARRVRVAGGRVVCAEDVFVHHWGRTSFGALADEEYRRLFDENRRKFEEKWGEPWRAHVARPARGAPGVGPAVAAARR